ncbi:porin family protein [Sphingomonas sp. UV9]|uniref:outer membrane protein n=1 Tax=Sphingomonas sp. UV9 TaxID=1851410 RepID=UPI000FFC27A3|nr:porin family protein [Sphingomonas sp. UV9]RXD02571.1 porin family protein [Sphingomonas sp. UV9]
MSLVTRTLFSTLALLVSSTAQAQTFSGPHVEAVVGLSHESREELNRDLKDDSLAYGGGGGYDVRTGNVVVGVLGEISGTTNKDCGTYDIKATPQTPGFAGRLCARAQRSLFAGARVGYVLGDHTLGYVLGGYENVRSKWSVDGTIDGVDAKRSDHASDDGFRVGAGFEHAVSDHAFIKAEYRYSRFGPQDPGAEKHQFVSGVGFRF